MRHLGLSWLCHGQPALQPNARNAVPHHKVQVIPNLCSMLMTDFCSLISTPRAICKGVGWLVVTLATMFPTMMDGSDGDESESEVNFGWTLESSFLRRSLVHSLAKDLLMWTSYDITSRFTVFNSCAISLPSFLSVISSSSSSAFTIFSVFATLFLKTTRVAIPGELKVNISSPK